MLEEIKRRLERLERENRRLRLALLALAFPLLLATIVAAKSSSRISTEGIRILDHAGRPAIEMKVDAEGPSLEMRDSTGVVVARLAATKEGSTFKLIDTKGKNQIGLSGIRGEAGLALWDEDDNFRAGMIAARGGSNLSFLAADGKVRAFVGSDVRNGPQLALMDSLGKRRVQVAMNDEDNLASVQLKDEAEHVRGLMRVDDAPVFALFDENGDQRWSAKTYADATKVLKKTDAKSSDCVIQIHQSASDITDRYEELCEIVGKAPFGKDWEVVAYRDLRAKACACGADGVIYQGQSHWEGKEPPDFTDGHGEIQGLAIRRLPPAAK